MDDRQMIFLGSDFSVNPGSIMTMEGIHHDTVVTPIKRFFGASDAELAAFSEPELETLSDQVMAEVGRGRRKQG